MTLLRTLTSRHAYVSEQVSCAHTYRPVISSTAHTRKGQVSLRDFVDTPIKMTRTFSLFE